MACPRYQHHLSTFHIDVCGIPVGGSFALQKAIDSKMKMKSHSGNEVTMTSTATAEMNVETPRLRFADFVVDEAASGRKRERTEAAIVAAVCQILDHTPLSGLTIAEICSVAGVANGTFYLYFTDRSDLIGRALLRFVDFVQNTMRLAGRAAGGDRIWNATATYYDLVAANPGLMRGLMNHSDDLPEATQAFQKLNHEWITAVVASLRRRPAMAALPSDELFRRAYALGGMIDQYLSALLLNRDPDLQRLSGDRDTTVNTLVALWKKGLLA
ncbi:TetR/AcrR family transcriptional regulator [Jiella sp. MQZ9-1]|uniref:TetR/AcrR family transcriptional regulator n=1 Tax=Jiella flava TaxID=2816857 RepID=A0A939JVE6_9HYPH|nr:TetR/AcrR family transcriptional regulator [Jiella flava]MBO0661897.1 TetR/AcrR family transcriptional regulator [Jiella flava]MCD2470775.1 TetR/AcrR family transcriptional regulator [Jiella flava]